MKDAKRFAIILLTVICMCCPLRSISAKDSFFDGESYVLYNITDDYLESQYRSNEQLDPGTLTQWMSAQLIIENTRHFDKEFTLRFSDSSGPYAYGFSHEENATVQDALFAMLLCNSSDMAKAAARHMAGREDEFIRLMNQKAANLGMKDTLFTNVSGDPDPEQRTTLQDLSFLIKAFLQNETVKKILAFDSYTFETNLRQYTLSNDIRYSFDSNSYCYVMETSNAQFYVTGIIEYMGKAFLLTGLSKTKDDCIALMTKGAQQIKDKYEKLIPLEKGSIIASNNLGWAFQQKIPVMLAEDITLVVQRSVSYDDLTYEFVSEHNPLIILPGQKLGTVDIYQENRLLKSEPVYTKNFYICMELPMLAAIGILVIIIYKWKKKHSEN